MIDTIKVTKIHNVPKEIRERKPESVYFMGREFRPRWNNANILTRYRSWEKNLIIDVFPEGKLNIQNSLHKFYASNNWSDFSILQVCEAVEFFGDTFGHDPKSLKLTRIDIGVNIEAKPIPEARSWKGYLTRDAEPIKSRKTKRIVGSKIELLDWSIKAYDKKREVYDNDGAKAAKQVPDPLTRIELSINRLRSLKPNFNTMADLTNRDLVNELAKSLLTRYTKIDKLNNYDWNGLNRSEIRVLCEMTTPLARQALKDRHKRTFLRNKKSLAKINSYRRLPSLESEISNKIKQLC